MLLVFIEQVGCWFENFPIGHAGGCHVLLACVLCVLRRLMQTLVYLHREAEFPAGSSSIYLFNCCCIGWHRTIQTQIWLTLFKFKHIVRLRCCTLAAEWTKLAKTVWQQKKCIDAKVILNILRKLKMKKNLQSLTTT